MDLETAIKSEVSQKEKSKYCILTHIRGIQKNGTDERTVRAGIQRHRENSRVDTVGRGSGVTWEAGIDVCTLECKLDSWWEAALQRRELSSMVCGDPGGDVGVRGDEQEVQEEGIQVYIELIHFTAQLK